MGRPSKLSENDKAVIRKRIIKGESLRRIAADYNMAYSSIRDGFSDQVRKIKDVANQIVTAERNLAELPVSAQLTAMDLAATLRAISNDLCVAAKTGTGNAVRLHSLAAVQLDVAAQDPENPDIEAIKMSAALTRAANEASVTGMQLLQANKGAPPEAPAKRKTLEDFYKDEA